MSKAPNLEDPMLVAALDYAGKGLRILPLSGKIPAVAGGHGYLDASNDPDQIRAWWTEYPGSNIGLAMRPNGLLALDVDPRNGGDATLKQIIDEHGPLPNTWKQETGGGGWHFVFRHDGRSYGSPGPGIEIKDNGYIVVAPSKHPDTGEFYKWLTLLDRDLLADPPGWLQDARPRSDRRPALIGLRDDAVFRALVRLGRVRLDARDEPNIRFTENGTEKVDITCPWVNKHTDKIDDGAAYFAGGGFRCHHAHCEHRRGRDLEDWLRQRGEDVDRLKRVRRDAIEAAKLLELSRIYRALEGELSITGPGAGR